jgi:hypothetical protein
MRSRLASAVAALGIVLALARLARADEPLGLEIAAKGGFMTNPFANGADPVHPGFGARAGVSISRIYFGLGLMYYLHGDTQTAPPTGSGVGGVPGVSTATISSHDLMVGGELGYDFPLLDLVKLRPQIGVGVWTNSSSCQYSPPASGASCSGMSITNAYVEPGVTALLLLGGHFLVGADVNGLVLPVNSGKQFFGALSMHAQVGVRF